MDTKLSKQTRRELLRTLRERYRNASKIEKTQFLDEFVDIISCHRKYAIHLLTGLDPVVSGGRALRSSWPSSRSCGVREKFVRPIAVRTPPPRTWRTWKDRVDDLWAQILIWLQQDPDSTAKSLDGTLGSNRPRPVSRGAAADLAASHSGVAPRDGKVACSEHSGCERSRRGADRRWRACGELDDRDCHGTRAAVSEQSRIVTRLTGGPGRRVRPAGLPVETGVVMSSS